MNATERQGRIGEAAHQVYIPLALKTLLAVAGLLLLGLMAIDWSVHRIDPFATHSLQYMRSMESLTVADLVALKGEHGTRHAPYRVGLFGNSRAVEVSNADIGLPPGEFFNFAVGGASFRQSVALIEYLSDRNSAPKTAIISLDNDDIGFGGEIYWPSELVLTSRPFDLFRMPVSLSEVVSGLSNWRHNIFDQFRAQLSFARVKSQIEYLWHVAMAENGAGRTGYLRDGALPRQVKSEALSMHFSPEALSPGYLRLVERDLWRIARIHAKGTRIFIYESPIHPKLRDLVARERPPNVIRFREAFAESCERNGIACYPAPLLEGPLPWGDCCHPPPALLGPFLAKILSAAHALQ